MEGHEHHVLKGATKLLKRGGIKYIQSEISAGMMGGEENARQYVRMLLDHGYEISLQGFEGPFLDFAMGKEFEPLKITRTDPQNIFCRWSSKHQ